MDATVMVAPLQYRGNPCSQSPDQPQKQPCPVLKLPIARGLELPITSGLELLIASDLELLPIASVWRHAMPD